MIIIFLSILAIVWLMSGFMAWGFMDGYMTTVHKKYRDKRDIPDTILLIFFCIVLGPASFLSVWYNFKLKYWTHLFWSKKRSNSLLVLEKFESYIE